MHDPEITHNTPDGFFWIDSRQNFSFSSKALEVL
jgi:hypothetical protein